LQQNGHDDKKLITDKDHTISRLASIGQISAGIAHEVRNPLTAVKGFLQLLQKENPHTYLDIAVSELDQAIDTLQDLLQVSKPDLDDEPYISINLCAELESLLYLFQDQMYRVQLVKSFQHTDAMMFGRKNLLKKAFFNLLKNAHEAIQEKGKITVSHQRAGDSIIVTISDTGVGIPEEKLELLGTPFFTTKNEGTGMGLTQVFSTIYQHGGKIDVSSRVGVGTTFKIEFPIQSQTDVGVVDLNLEYIAGHSFADYFAHNTGLFRELITSQAESIRDQINDLNGMDISFLYDSALELVNLLSNDHQHALVLHAKDNGREWARHDLPMISALEWFQSLRKVYWDFLYNYYKQVDLEKTAFFELERKTNYTLDIYVNHFSSTYMEHKNEILRSHRELIEDLSVPIIPLSSSMAVLPIVGTMDTYRAKRIQEQVLNQIGLLRINRIIIDLSGVAFLDTAVVKHLFRIVEGISILGCKAIVTGIRPEIANTMIELGLTLTDKVETRGTLQQALEVYGL
jgi:rsbT co-antagonist protein RsbR